MCDGETLTFNGADISLRQNVYSLTQRDHINRFSTLAEERINMSEFVSERARGAYIAAVCRPDITFGFAQCSKVTQLNVSAVKVLNKMIETAQRSADYGLKFVPLDKKSVRLAAFSDASFATNQDLTSQLGFFITLAGSHGNANVLHYTSVKSKRITRSVLAAELFAAVNAFDYASTLRVTINEVFGRFVPLVLYTDSKSLFESIVGTNMTTEKGYLLTFALSASHLKYANYRGLYGSLPPRTRQML